MNWINDNKLVFWSKQGSTQALTQIYEKYKADLLILALALLNNRHAAEDVVHDVFLRFVQDLSGFRLTGSLRSYLMTCTANQARNRIKTDQHRRERHEAASKSQHHRKGPVQSAVFNEHALQLGKLMNQLPYEQREVLILHFYGNMSLSTIGRDISLPVNTVKSRYRYAMQKMRSLFHQEANT